MSTTLSSAMPQLDVGGSLVSHDGGAAAEPELEAARGCDETAALPYSDRDPYAPAESLRLRIGEDIDWSDVVVGGAVAAVLERDDSTKGAAANPKSCAARRSAAGRSSLSAPAPAPRAAAVAVVIGGLTAKATRDHGRRRSPCQLQLGGRARVFASGEAPGHHHQAEAEAEPGSPKVSCLGGVRSQPRTAAEGAGITSGGRRWWPWLMVADVMSFCCCWNGRRHRRPTASEAE